MKGFTKACPVVGQNLNLYKPQLSTKKKSTRIPSIDRGQEPSGQSEKQSEADLVIRAVCARSSRRPVKRHRSHWHQRMSPETSADLNNWRKHDRACVSGFLSESVLRFPVENLQEDKRTHHLGFCVRWEGSPRKNTGELGQLLLGRVLSSSVPSKQQLQMAQLVWEFSKWW